jgi:hypothetical protein
MLEAPGMTEYEKEQQHIRGLVVIREALRLRGASQLELRRCDATIRAAERRLAAAARAA